MFKTILVASLALPFSLSAATRAQDYETVRKIAQRDPKVRAAYEAADRKLAERIVEIDPSLRGYKPGQPEPKPQAKAPAPKPTPKPVAKPAPAPKANGTKHKVAQGETFESIATQYRVGVPTLKQANPGVQERKLQVGQTIIVPKKYSTASASQPKATKAKPAPAPAKEKSWWEKLAE